MLPAATQHAARACMCAQYAPPDGPLCPRLQAYSMPSAALSRLSYLPELHRAKPSELSSPSIAIPPTCCRPTAAQSWLPALLERRVALDGLSPSGGCPGLVRAEAPGQGRPQTCGVVGRPAEPLGLPLQCMGNLTGALGPIRATLEGWLEQKSSTFILRPPFLLSFRKF